MSQLMKVAALAAFAAALMATPSNAQNFNGNEPGMYGEGMNANAYHSLGGPLQGANGMCFTYTQKELGLGYWTNCPNVRTEATGNLARASADRAANYSRRRAESEGGR
jgi:hypothetical protein